MRVKLSPAARRWSGCSRPRQGLHLPGPRQNSQASRKLDPPLVRRLEPIFGRIEPRWKSNRDRGRPEEQPGPAPRTEI
eukprot:7990886-Heterocapsa_arctica.AAC.1